MQYVEFQQLIDEFGAERINVFEPQPDLLPLGQALTPQIKVALESTMSPTRKPHIPAHHLDHIRRLNGIGFTLSTHTVMDCDVSALLSERLLYLLGMGYIGRSSLRTVLHETLLNAAIHGNMGIHTPAITGMDGFTAMHEAIAKKREDASIMQRLITTIFAPDGETVRFVVCDEGAGFDTSTFKPVAPAETRANGRGLKMVAGMAENLTFHDGGSTIEFAIRK